MRLQHCLSLSALALTAQHVHALDLDVNSVDSITTAAKTIATRVAGYYSSNGTGIPGILPEPYYWWESGLALDSLIRYWALTGDSTYNALVHEALLFQLGPDENYMPPNQTKSEGNDDQSSWALAAMTAAEYGFPAPTQGLGVSWQDIVQNVFDSQVARWDAATCGGGLRWQIFTFNTGYNYKNSLSNGDFVQLAARLSRYTGNTTYDEWARNGTQWAFNVGMISNETGSEGAVWDGTDANTNCSQWNHLQWTSSVGTFYSAAAYAANATSTLFWQGFTLAWPESINATFTIGNTSVLYEAACEPQGNCNADQLAFKAIGARALANARDMASDFMVYHRNNTNPPSANASSFFDPGTPVGTMRERINVILEASALGAAAQCSGGDDGTVCGQNWNSSTWDGSMGLGQDLSALEIMLANLPAKVLATQNEASSASNGTATATNSTSSGVPGAVASATAVNGAIGTHGSTFALVCGLGIAIAMLL